MVSDSERIIPLRKKPIELKPIVLKKRGKVYAIRIIQLRKMNLTEKFKRGTMKTVSYNRKPPRFGAKPFMRIAPSQITPYTKKDSTPSSKINWGKSHQSISNSSAIHSETSREDVRIILALSEGRGEARCEVGIAAINVSQPNLILCQISDTQSYDNTLRKINIFNPTQILVPMTFVETATQSRLIEKVKEQFPSVNYTPVKRNTFNKSIGMEYIQELCLPSLNSVLLVLQYRYYALTAASALLRFLQSNLNIFYASGSIKIDYQESEGYALIDVSTADRLELVSSTKPLQASKYSTLFGVLNNCYTKIGERALRTILLQPPFATFIILERQECVTALMKHPEKLQSIQVMLQKMVNIDQLLTLPTIVIDDSQYCSNRQLNYMLLLNGLVDLIITMNEIISGLEQPFFKKISNTLKSEDFLYIKDIVRTLIHENAYAAKSHNGLLQRCFAIKPGVNGLLDLVRKIYSERLDDMREYVKSLGEKYDLPLTLGNNITKGYHIVFSLNKHQKISMKKSDLPREFIQVCRLAGSFTMKTMELINFQSRIDDIVADILKISNVMIFKTLTSLKKYMGIFHKLCEDIANIDVIQSLAEVSIRNNYVRPTFADYTEVKDSQHPMLDMLAHEKPVPNLISSCEDFNVHIITGPNGSGKSIFIRQVMLLQIMAQIGVYVPASSAVFRSADRLFARVYLEDNMECGASSFVLEMKEIIYILSHMTNNSLIIMDELARSTSLEEGASLAMAICEHLSDSSAFVYLTSHYTLVTKLGDMYLNVRNWHMDTDASGDTPRSLKLDFKYTLKSGVTNLKNYGIFMVKNIWPADILEDVYDILEHSSRPQKEAKAQKISKQIRLKYQLESNLRKLKSKGNLKLSKVNELINHYRHELERLNIRLGNVNLDDNDQNQELMTHSDHFLNPYFDDNVSDDVLSEIADKVIGSFPLSPQENYQFHSYEDNLDNCSESSSYRQLSHFIGENSENLQLLNPEIHISYPDGEPDETLSSEEINPTNRSLLEAMKDQETKRIQILSNIIVKGPAMNVEASDEMQKKYFQGLLMNANCNDADLNHLEDVHISQKTCNSSQEFEEMNEFNRSLLTEMQLAKKNFIESYPETKYNNMSPVDNSFSSKNSDHMECNVNLYSQHNTSDLLPPPQPSIQMKKETNVDSTEIVRQIQDYQFVKPFDKLSKKRTISGTQFSSQKNNLENLNDTNQFQFSWPLIQNRAKTSTPIVTNINFDTNSLGNASCSSVKCPNANFYKYHSNTFKNTRCDSVDKKSQNILGDEQKIKHIFPKVKIVQGPNDLSQSFGEEDKKQKRYPTRIYDEKTNDNEDKHNLEKWALEEVKVFLRGSPDIFEGDLDSLEVTIDNHEIIEPAQKTILNPLQRNEKNKSSDSQSVQNGEVLTENLHCCPAEVSEKMDEAENIKSVNQQLCENLNPTLEPTPEDITITNVENEKNKVESIRNGMQEGSSPKENRNFCSEFPDDKFFEDDSRELDNFLDELTMSRSTIQSKCFKRDKLKFPGQPSNENSKNYLKNNTESSDSKHDLNFVKGIERRNFSKTSTSNSFSSDSKDKLVTCSISDASRKRNFDEASHDKLTDYDDENISTSEASRKRNLNIFSSDESKSTKRRTSTSISEASRLRNLENVSSNSSTDRQSGTGVKQKTIKSMKNVKDGERGVLDASLMESPKTNVVRDLTFSKCKTQTLSDSSSSYETAETMDLSDTNRKRGSDNKKDDCTKSIEETWGEYKNDNEKEPDTFQYDSTYTPSSVSEENQQFIDSGEHSDYKSGQENSSLDRSFKTDKPNKFKKVLGYTKRAVKNSEISSKQTTRLEKTDEIKPKRRKFIFGSSRLTKHEIQEEFDRQDQILLEKNVDSETYSRYLKQRFNRPSVKQIQSVEHVATFRRTENGTMVLPAKKKTYKPKKSSNKILLETSNVFNVSIFSDQNANKMSAFLASSEKNYNLFEFNFKDEVVHPQQSPKFCSQFVEKSRKFDFARSKSFPFYDLTNLAHNRIFKFEAQLNHSNYLVQTQPSQDSSMFIPDGYFKEHKRDIEDICSKYLCNSESLLYKTKSSPC